MNATALVQLGREILDYRVFVLSSIRREVESQFRGALLGSAWILIQPLALILIYTLVFSQVMGARLPGVESNLGYSIYLMAGLLPWMFFADGLARLQSVFVAHANLMKHASFPRIALPLIALGTASFSFFVTVMLFFGFLVLAGAFPGWVVLAALPALVIQILLILGLGVLAATLNVFFRDIGQAVSVGLMLWFWLTPIVYPASILPGWAQDWLWLNPFATLAQHYQQIMLHAVVPEPGDWLALMGVALLSVALLTLSWHTYRKRMPEMVDEL